MHHPRLRSLGIVVSFALAALVLAGCTVPMTLSANRSQALPEPIEASAWRLVETPVLTRLSESTPAEFRVEGPDQLASRRITANVLNDGGLLRAWEETEAGRELRLAADDEPGEGLWTDLFVSFVPNGAFLPSLWVQKEGPIELLAADASDASTPLPEVDIDQGLDVRIPDADECATAKGLMLFLPAMLPNEYEDALVEHLRADGWAMAFLDVRLAPPNDSSRARSEARQRQQIVTRELREEHTKMSEERLRQSGELVPLAQVMREHTEIRDRAAAMHPEPPKPFLLTGDASPTLIGEQIALAVDRQLAAHAFAGDALVRATLELRPELAGKPVVIVGCSAGSLYAPVIAARLRESLGDRLRAVVLIGSGAEVLSLAQRSTLTDAGLELAPDGEKPDKERYAQALSAYRSTTTLDRDELALAFADVPVLHHYALFDEIVPTRNARVLNGRIKNLDTLVHIGGHKSLFYFLPSQNRRICAWINARAFPD